MEHFVDIGAMRHQVGIYQASRARDAAGNNIETFPGSATDTVWASFKHLRKGTEVNQAGRTEAQNEVVFGMYYNPDITINEKDRIVYDSRTFRITRIDEIEGIQKKVMVYAIEVMT